MNGLPNGYIGVDYIETTGAQYINLGFVPNQDTHVVVEAMWMGGDGIYGARTAVASNNFSLRVISGNWQSGYDTVLTSGVAADEEWHIFEQRQNVFSVDGVVVNTHAPVNFTSPKTFTLGGINAKNDMYYGKGRYRSCQRYATDGALLLDVRACINPDGEVGMYDLVSRTFYANAGTGSFIAGDIVAMPRMITDRTAQDVDRVKVLAAKTWQDMTAEEQSEWLSPMKGSYNYTDLNRVEDAVAYVAGRLNEFGYLPYQPVTRSWSAEDIPNESDLAKYFGNVATLRRAIAVWASTPEAPSSINGFGVNEANALEQILVDVDLVLTRISQAWFYSGDLYSAEV